jgi:hypothetical protein
MKVVDIADEIYRELGSPTDLSISAIAFWVRTNIGELNNYLMATYVVDATTLEVKTILEDDTEEEISPEAVSIIKKMYNIHNYDLEIRKNLISISTDSIIEVSDQGSSVRKINRNEVSKTLSNLRRQEVDTLTDLVTAYRLRNAAPRQVAGNDTVEGAFNSNDTTTRDGLY